MEASVHGIGASPERQHRYERLWYMELPTIWLQHHCVHWKQMFRCHNRRCRWHIWPYRRQANRGRAMSQMMGVSMPHPMRYRNRKGWYRKYSHHQEVSSAEKNPWCRQGADWSSIRSDTGKMSRYRMSAEWYNQFPHWTREVHTRNQVQKGWSWWWSSWLPAS